MHPHASGNLSEICRIFKVADIMNEVTVSEQLENAGTPMIIILTFLVNTGLKAQLTAATE